MEYTITDTNNVAPAKGAKKLAKRYAEDFALCYDYLKSKQPETTKLRKLYDNKNPTSWLVQNPTEKEKDKLFSCGEMSRAIIRRAAIMVDGHQKPYINPVLKEDANEIVSQWAANEQLPKWVIDGINASGSVEDWLNELCDSIFNDWYAKEKVARKIYVLVKNALLYGKSWFKLRVKDEQIILEQLDFGAVCEDPLAKNISDRRFVFHYKLLETTEVAKMYGISESSIVPDDVFSDKETNRKRVRLIEGWYKSPNTICAFLLNQGDYPQGVRVLMQEENPYGGICPIIDFIPEPDHSELDGRPARDIAFLHNLEDRVMQQGMKNFELCGVPLIMCDPAAMQNPALLNNKTATIIPIAQGHAVEVRMPGNLSTESLNLTQYLSNVIQDQTGLQDVSQGKKSGRVEAAKAYIVLNEAVNRAMRPSIERLNEFLETLATVWAKMALNSGIYNAGAVVRTGNGLRTRHKLPFALSAVIADMDEAVSESSQMPLSDQDRANLYMTLGGMMMPDGVPVMVPKTIIDGLKLENGGQILRDRAAYLEGLHGSAQMQQQAQGMGEQLQQMQAAMEQLTAENQTLNMKIQAQEHKTQADLTKTEMNNEAAQRRIATSTQGKIMATQIKNDGEARKTIMQKMMERITGGNKEQPPMTDKGE